MQLIKNIVGEIKKNEQSLELFVQDKLDKLDIITI